MDIQGDSQPSQPLTVRFEYPIYVLKIVLIVFFGVGAILGFFILRAAPKVALWCTPNVTVSLHGGGSLSSIMEAVHSAPSYSAQRYCIHIKAGIYVENIFVPSDRTNLAFIGEGMNHTVIVANRTCQGHFCEPQGPTLWIQGNGFFAVDLAIVNREDPVSLPAVAVESWSDRSTFYRCRLEGRHGALYVPAGRQFYRECHLHGSGTIVSGASRAFFQNCLVAVNESIGQNSIIAAEGSETPTSPGGFAFHRCQISVDGEPRDAPLLGEPVTAYAIIIYMECIIELQGGWSHGNFVPGTMFFAEYGNTRTDNTLSPDVHVMDETEASHFSLRNFYSGYWIPSDEPHSLDLDA